MEHADALSFIQAGVTATGETWADLGAGRGVFTRALSELLGLRGEVIAVDRDARALHDVGTPPATGTKISLYPADFRGPLELPELDGLLLANSLHFVRRQERVLRQLLTYLRPGGKILIVEYDVRQSSPWNPYPVPQARFGHLAATVGLQGITELNRRPSRFGGRDLYVAVALKPLNVSK